MSSTHPTSPRRFFRTASLAFAAVASIAFACSRTLPSDQPLGLGPTAVLDRQLEEQQQKKHAVEQSEGDFGDAETFSVTAEPEDAGTSDAETDAEPDADAADGAADSGSDAGSASAFAFAGEYLGEDTMVIRLPGMPERTETDDKARTLVKQDQPDRITVSIINSANGDVICSFGAKVNGDRATVDADAECFGEAAVRGAVTSGQIRVDGKRLILDLAAQLEAGGRTLGEIEYHFEGDRQ